MIDHSRYMNNNKICSSSTPKGVGVVGIGYVGLVTAVALAELGHRVVCLDVNVDRLVRLRSGSAPFHEPDLDQRLQTHLHLLQFTSDPRDVYDNTDFVFVCVDTPPTQSGDADLSRVEAVVAAIPAGFSGTLVMKSTVPVGTGTRVQERLRQLGHTTVGYVSNPEFLREGCAIADVLHPDRVVAGADSPELADAVLALWSPLGGVSVRCDLHSAEMIKLASNAFLATKISFINEIANVCDVVGADVAAVAHGMGLDRRIGPAFLQAGIGYGGSCFPKDVVALKQLAGNRGYHFQLLSSVIEVNNLQGRRLIGTLKARLGPLAGRRIALLGLSFKPGTDDMREAPSLVLAARLIAEGARLVAHDPVSNAAAKSLLPQGVELAETWQDAITGADAALIITDWPEYLGLTDADTSALMATPLLIDGRNLLDPSAASSSGYEWVGVGRPTHLPAAPTTNGSAPLDEVAMLTDALTMKTT